MSLVTAVVTIPVIVVEILTVAVTFMVTVVVVAVGWFKVQGAGRLQRLGFWSSTSGMYDFLESIFPGNWQEANLSWLLL